MQRKTASDWIRDDPADAVFIIVNENEYDQGLSASQLALRRIHSR